jgi:hypothetical protein
MKLLKLILCTLLFISATTTFSQEASKERKFDFPRRNSIYIQNLIIFPGIYYDRILPLTDKFGLIPKIGFISGLGYGNFVVFEPAIFIGGNKHYIELGAVTSVGVFSFTGNYRYMAKKGFLFKAGGVAGGPFIPVLFLGLGYSF